MCTVRLVNVVVLTTATTCAPECRAWLSTRSVLCGETSMLLTFSTVSLTLQHRITTHTQHDITTHSYRHNHLPAFAIEPLRYDVSTIRRHGSIVRAVYLSLVKAAVPGVTFRTTTPLSSRPGPSSKPRCSLEPASSMCSVSAWYSLMSLSMALSVLRWCCSASPPAPPPPPPRPSPLAASSSSASNFSLNNTAATRPHRRDYPLNCWWKQR